MRKQLKALLITVALVTLSTGLIGCNNEKKQQQTTTQVETTENKVENNIEFKSDGARDFAVDLLHCIDKP